MFVLNYKMLCNICSKRIPNNLDLICYFCNFVCCVGCQIDNKGNPKKRLFHYCGSTLCGNCYTQVKYENL